ncbi:hypothetical protein DXG03_001081 [Asterophora parasitica]|uniref:RING-type domain-containing protein n=1 Tax=Asterophora parasitica TaxID=117018 RepID=A0A9P7KCP7_9AGAR|nr:hypothetical protein DXG03_001081 [Asterophora parasitica]
MGNSSSSSGRGHHYQSVDYGHLSPQGVYTGPKDWNQAVVTQLICGRRLAPFYRPLEDYEESWDDDQILAARKEPPAPESDSNDTVTRIEAAVQPLASPKSSHSKRPGALKEPIKPEAAVYRGAVECPICFLAICTECFVQIKRNEPTTTHLVSEPAACPYCVQDNFGVVYTPPPWRAGIGSDSVNQIRPDWEAKLAAVRAAVTRRANRRIIMRQVGDRLIPVGVTSGRVHALSPEEAQAEGVDSAGSRRSRRRQQAAQNQNFEQFMGMGGQDLEELMLMEAMRLSMIDHEEHQRKEAEEKRKQEEAAVAAAAQSEANNAASTSTSAAGPSSLELPTGHLISVTPSPSPSTPISSSPVSISQVKPRDSLAAKRNSLLSSLSRSRTRTPPPPNASSGSPRNSVASSSSWHWSSSPAPYSTLTAAMSAASVANAVLGGSSSSTGAGDSATNGEVTSGLPSIPAAAASEPSPSSTPSSTPEAADQAESSQQPGSPHDQTSAAAPYATSPYDNLPSSPESLVAYEPLLGSSSRTPEEPVL